MMKMELMIFFFLNFFVLGAFAEKPETKTTLTFDDELVEGATQKPDLFYLLQKKSFNYKKLIKLRENFLPEMRKTIDDIHRIRGPQ